MPPNKKERPGRLGEKEALNFYKLQNSAQRHYQIATKTFFFGLHLNLRVLSVSKEEKLKAT